MNLLLGVVWVAAVGVLYWLDVIAGRPAVALIILAAACCAAVVAACRIRDEREAWKQLQRDRGELDLAFLDRLHRWLLRLIPDDLILAEAKRLRRRRLNIEQRDRGSVNVFAAITTLALLTAICIAGWLVAVAIHHTLGAL